MDRGVDRWANRKLSPENPALLGLDSYAGKMAFTRRLGRAVELRQLSNGEFDEVRTRLGHKGPYLPVLFEACRENQLAEEYRDGNKSFGAFTYAVMTCLREARANREEVSYNTIIDRARELLQKLGKSQEPVVVGPTGKLALPVPMSMERITPESAKIVGEPKALSAVDMAVKKHRDDFMKIPGVLGVRSGYKFRDGWITKEKAVVVTVRSKLLESQLSASQKLPPSVTITDSEGKKQQVPVDIEPASPLQQLVADRLLVADLTIVLPVTNGRYWAWRNRRIQPVPQANRIEAEEKLYKSDCRRRFRRRWRLFAKRVLQLVSVLKEFLEGTKKRLTMGMYDLTAPHVVETLIESLGQSPRKFMLVLDPKIALGNGGGGDNPKAADLGIETTVRNDLEPALRIDSISPGLPSS